MVWTSDFPIISEENCSSPPKYPSARYLRGDLASREIFAHTEGEDRDSTIIYDGLSTGSKGLDCE